MSQLQTVRLTIRESGLLNEGDRVLVALSGGPDSVALLHMLITLRPEYRLTLSALYINHKVRKRAAKTEEQFCAQLCARLKVKFLVESADIPAMARRQKKGIEETARDFRYQTFERLARELSFNKVALGHHADDQAETILFRILRGTGLSGLRGMPASRDRIIRPMLRLRREDILTYLTKHKLEFCTDQSNSTIDFARNYLRNKLLPQIRMRLNPSVDAALINLAETAGDEDEYLQKITRRKFGQFVSFTSGGKLRLALEPLCKEEVWLRRRLLRQCLVTLSVDGLPPDRSSVNYLEELVRKGKGSVSLPGRIQAAVRNGELILYRQGKAPFEVPLVLNEPTILPMSGLIFSIKVLHCTDQRTKQRRSLKITMDNSAVNPPLLVRSIRPGDRFTPLGLRGTKKVGDYLTDRKVNRVLRDEIPVVCDKNGIIWLVGFEIADRVKIKEDTKEVIEIEVAEQPKHQPEAI